MPGESPLSMMRPPPRPLRKPVIARSSRRLWVLSAAIVIALAILWVYLWYYAAAVADRTLAGWMQREATAGRAYSCGSQSIGGFPFSIVARCTDAAAEIKNSQPTYALRTTATTFTAEVWHPTKLVGDISGPFTVSELGQPPLITADWARARLVLVGVPPNPESIAIKLDEPHVERADATAGNSAELFKAARADLAGRITGGAPNDHPVIEFTLRLTGASAPTFHPLLAAPLDVELDARLRGLKDLSPKPWSDRFREMQTVDGAIEIKSLRLAQANVIVVGTGTLNINGNGKLEGLIRVAVVGIDRLVPLLGLDRLIVQGIDQLSGAENTLDRLVPGLSGAVREGANAGLIENLRKMGQPTTIDNKPAIVLPLRVNDGSIYLGMLRVGAIPPLF
jgi:hypothetical protein